MDKLIPELWWPKFKWHFNVWQTIVLAWLAYVLSVFPGMMEGRSAGYRVLVGVLIFLSVFLLIMTIQWLFTAGRTIVRRVIFYPKLMETYNVERRDLTEINEALTESNTELHKTGVYLLQNHFNARSFEIRKAAFTKGRIYILLARKSGYKMVVGDIVDVIDQEDNRFMGRFKVIELRENDYYAVGTGKIDGLWSGYVREQGETEVMPRMVAICIFEGGYNG